MLGDDIAAVSFSRKKTSYQGLVLHANFLLFITYKTTTICPSKTITASSMMTKLFALLKFWKIHILIFC